MILHLGLLASLLLPQVDDAEARLALHRRHLEMRDSTPHADLAWRWIGPHHMSGRVTDVAVPEGSRWTVYVATASGGLWKTTNEGTTWQPLLEDTPSASTGAVACAPTAPDTVWVGLGEANILRSSMSGTGVYKSTDAGRAWTHMGLAESHHVARIVVDPRDENVVWVAASGKEWVTNPERGVYKTTDGGRTWEHVLFVDERTGAIDLALAPDDPDTVYAAMWDRIRLKWSDPKPGPGSAIFKSTDGGRTWHELRQGLPSKGSFGRVGLAVTRADPAVVYALVDNHEIARQPRPGERDSYGRPRDKVIKGAEVYRSDDRGATWRRVSEPSPVLEGAFSTYGWVFGQIRADPSDADRVWALGVPLLRSTDGGKTFRRVDYPDLHGDHHALWIDRRDPNRVINGNDGGVNFSYDGGRTWKDDESLPCVQLYNVAVDDRRPFRVYGSIQDNNSWMGPHTHDPLRHATSDWQACPGGESSYHAVDPADGNVLYSESFYGRIQRSTLEPRQTVSIVPKAAPGDPPLRGQWLAPFLISPHNPRVVYHGMQYVFRSLDRGDHWQRLSPDLSHDDPQRRGDIQHQVITSIDESPRRFGRLYAGTDDGRVWTTSDSGQQWDEITPRDTAGKWVSRVVASAFHDGTVYLAQNGKRDCDFQAYLRRSKDHGATWQDIAAGIPGGPLNVVREDPSDAAILYAGSDLGVYVTTDGGRTWQVLGKGLPITFVHDLVVHPRDGILVAATHGRGFWTLDVKPLRERVKRARWVLASSGRGLLAACLA